MVDGFTLIYAIGGTTVVVIDGGWIYNYLYNRMDHCGCDWWWMDLQLPIQGPIHNEFAIAFKECKPFFVRCMKKSNMVNEFTSTYQIRAYHHYFCKFGQYT
jgi:hypothetical protein